MRMLLSTVAVIANVLVLLLLLIAVLGQTVLRGHDAPIPASVFFIEAGFAALAFVNLAAVLAGARAFKPRPPTSDVVATFN
jgi:hypothetical protein